MNSFIKKILVCSVILFALAFSFFPLRKYKVTRAQCTPIQIGYFYDYEMVNRTTKIYVSGTLKTIVSETGRTIYSEDSGGMIPIQSFDIISEAEEPNGPIQPGIKRYYYYANQTNPRIIGKTNLFNNLDSVIHVIEQLEKDANHLNLNDPKNSIMSYLRSIKTSYYSQTILNVNFWERFAGSVDENFIQIVNNQNHGNLTIAQFFAAFMTSSEFNSSLYGSVDLSYFHNYRLIDPFDEGHDIDLIHFFASLDGCFYGTGSSSTFDIDTNFSKCITSWGGDLQTSLRYFYSHQDDVDENFDFCTNVLNNTSSTFTWDDLISDIDAFNIGLNYSLLVTSFDISEIISNYYSQNAFNRYEYFREKVEFFAFTTHDPGFSFNNYVNYVAGIGINGNSLVEYSLVSAKYSLLKTYSTMYMVQNWLPVDKRIIVVESFIEFINSKI